MSTSSPSYPGVYIQEAPAPVNIEHRVANEYALSTRRPHKRYQKEAEKKGVCEWDIRGPTIQRIKQHHIFCYSREDRTSDNDS